MSEKPAAPQPFLEKLSDDLQRLVKEVVGSNKNPPRRLKSFLNGTWFGHPLHPVLTDVPVVAWMLTSLFDLIWLLAPASFWVVSASRVTVIIGLLTHALFNGAATVLYLLSLILRLLAGPGDSFIAALFGFVGLGCVIYAAYLGGDMVFSKGTSVNHTAWEAAGSDYEAVMPADNVEENKLFRVTVSGVPVALVRQGTQWYAFSATCPHAGGPLNEGKLTGDVVECPWHGSQFCITDGRVRGGPATVNVPRYDVRIRNGQVEAKRMGQH
jgi:nitrite reductase/ring-hydroxylating ferredoxin subunit